MKIYTKITIDIDTGKTVEEESFEYSGPVASCATNWWNDPGRSANDDNWEDSNPSTGSDPSSDTSTTEEGSNYEKMLEEFYNMFQAISSGAYNKTGQLVGGRGNVGSAFSYMPQLQKDNLSMQLAAFAPYMEDYKWNNPQATDDDSSWFEDLFGTATDAASMFGMGKLFKMFG